MTRIFSVALLGIAVCFPVSVTSVSGGSARDCTGAQGVLHCIPSNGVMCVDIGNAYEASTTKVVKQSTTSWSCAEENGTMGMPNNDCTGTAKKTTNSCNTP